MTLIRLKGVACYVYEPKQNNKINDLCLVEKLHMVKIGLQILIMQQIGRYDDYKNLQFEMKRKKSLDFNFFFFLISTQNFHKL